MPTAHSVGCKRDEFADRLHKRSSTKRIPRCSLKVTTNGNGPEPISPIHWSCMSTSLARVFLLESLDIIRQVVSPIHSKLLDKPFRAQFNIWIKHGLRFCISNQ